MLALFATAIEESCYEWGIDVKRRNNYRGRGQNEDTVGIVGEQSDIIMAIAATAARYGEIESEKTDEFVKAVGKLRWDNMGQGTIAY